ncbi:hypothetical protein [Xinfangfangia pollutisoli]|uniref:hypothetical protein n=1 Tax=Xinfangfangia pollutisoli TaxID=2865960 RepID=UPI001CD57570|nr:hypothetical protein [Xinfangfangia pollutisoli]
MVRAILLVLALWAGAADMARAEGNLSMTIRPDGPVDHLVAGEMVAITIRAVYDRKIANERLEIAPTDAFDWVQTQADDWHQEMIDGLPWIVMERHLAIWPKRTGPLQFGPAQHRLTIIDTQSQRQDTVVTAPPLTLSVGPFPAQTGWHFTARQVELTDTLSTDPAHLQDGELVTRTVTLRALGALPEHLPPRPVVSENWLITFAAPVQRNLILTGDGPVAEAIWTWQFRPHTGEPGVLDPVKIPFFNTESRKLDAVEIPALSIGLASFYTGQVPTGRVGGAQVLLLAGVTLTALLLALGLAATRLAPQATAAGLHRLCRHWSPLPRLRLWRAQRSGDLLALRRAMAEADLPAARQAALDRRIYGPPVEGVKVSVTE